MSKDHALRFLMLVHRDEDFKNKYESLMGKYEGRNLSEAELDKIIADHVTAWTVSTWGNRYNARRLVYLL